MTNYAKVHEALKKVPTFDERQEIRRESFRDAAKATPGIDRILKPGRNVGEYSSREILYRLAAFCAKHDAWEILVEEPLESDPRDKILQEIHSVLSECAYCPFCQSAGGGHNSLCLFYEIGEVLNE